MYKQKISFTHENSTLILNEGANNHQLRLQVPNQPLETAILSNLQNAEQAFYELVLELIDPDLGAVCYIQSLKD